MTTRAPVEVILGSAPGAVRGIEGDFALLDDPAGQDAIRTWTCTETAVVLGVSRDLAAEVVESECERRGTAVLRRASGGGTVVVGPGTLQYAFVIPHPIGSEPPPIDHVKLSCNRFVREALSAAGIEASIESDPSGDLRVEGRKVGGVALRRRRDATLLHGTLLVEADLRMIAAVLRHPAREPAWRRGRSHVDFLANLGIFDVQAFCRELRTTAAN